MSRIILLTIISFLFLQISCEKFCGKAESVSKATAVKLEAAWKCNGDEVYRDLASWFNKYLCKNYPLPPERFSGISVVCNIVLYEAGKLGAAYIAREWQCDLAEVEKDLTLPAKFCPLLELIPM